MLINIILGAVIMYVAMGIFVGVKGALVVPTLLEEYEYKLSHLIQIVVMTILLAIFLWPLYVQKGPRNDN